MNSPQVFTAFDIAVTADEQVLPEVVEHARDEVGAVVRAAHLPIRSVRVRLTPHGDPELPYSVVAQANLLAAGRLVRAQADGRNSWEAIDRLQSRLREVLAHLTSGEEARQENRSSPGIVRWPHRSCPDEPSCWYPRPEEEREIVRHKSYPLRRCTVDDAAHDMGLLDYDFHLFTEAGTGRDALLHRVGPTGYRLVFVTPPGPHEPATFQLPVTISAELAPLLNAAAAVVRLNRLGSRFLLFRDVDSGRGAVLYRRYDGHYGLITSTLESRGDRF
ncbi:sigma 54 modulation/S30EA ribosomal C-terminal domain-containing protein [Amycolatopsis taiwanensis]|uniref:sigma 54 modulation/S30EA ribosomal C-terminal domain-containing protein n=1 Tax=Amycolatopsis taiwanensis TaxID=342230 RepID=UPI000489C547|nr:sigma 54 modulation/S30EA ribosomal C-terminal domain-containing protein [Amycolatopsis taiwanensis]